MNRLFHAGPAGDHPKNYGHGDVRINTPHPVESVGATPCLLPIDAADCRTPDEGRISDAGATPSIERTGPTALSSSPELR